MKYILSFLSLCFSLVVYAQDYKVSLIPDSLKENASVVQRFEEERVVIKSIDKAIITHKCAVTILNEAGDRYSTFEIEYNKLRTLNFVVGRLFDADGKQLKKVKEKEMADQSEAAWFEFVSDSRKKTYSFYHKSYPYTVEFESEIELHGIYHLTEWRPMSFSGDYSVQQSRFVVEAPSDYNLRYKQFNYPTQPVITTSGSTSTYYWEVFNQPVVKNELWQPSAEEYMTSVVIAPTKFSVGGYTGDMSTWDGLGKFQLTLNKGRNELPDNIKQEIHKLADKLTTKQEKVEALYNYLQLNTRYISIQLGIGGWQPFEAKFVAEKKYGDCKALSNYMVSILKEAGIDANYVIVKAGSHIKQGLWKDFPAPYFNHIICCVPDKDTIWLECTSQTESPGYMGTFTGNRNALIVTENGGVVAHTPVYSANDNKTITYVSANIAEDGTLVADVNTIYSGIAQEYPHNLYHGNTQKERDEYYNHKYNLPTYKVENISYKETKGKIPLMDEYLSITSSGYASITGKRLFVLPNLFSKIDKLPTDKPRKFDILIDESHTAIDTITLTIPKGFKLESTPKNVVLNNKFGFYSIEYNVKENIITTIRTHIENENRFPASDYLELAKFYDQMYKADRAKMVFVKSE